MADEPIELREFLVAVSKAPEGVRPKVRGPISNMALRDGLVKEKWTKAPRGGDIYFVLTEAGKAKAGLK